ncbi:MAG: roadblock/LC7 domain-containing protein [Candidatus Thermoplasmatota archaeon]|nr:roadblock/LC7 domain-containing protein [Candidatus Thermoplasmatota archaeon]
MDEFKKVFEGLKKEGVLGLALVDKKGNVIKSDLPSDVHDETFGMMSATIIGASCRANPKLSKGGVERSIVHSKKGNIIISNTSGGLILSVLVDESQDTKALTEKIDKAANEIMKIA